MRLATSRVEIEPGPAVHGFQRVFAAVADRSVALRALIGVAVPSLAVMGFWALAARNHEPDGFAPAFALVSVIAVIGQISSLGLADGLIRYLPGAGPATSSMLARTTALSGGLAVVLTVVVVLGLDLWVPELLNVRQSLLLTVFAVLVSVSWALYPVADATMASLFPDQDWVWMARCALTAGRVGLVLALVTLTDGGAEGRILLAWGLPVVLTVVGIGVAVGRPLLVDRASATPLLINTIPAATVPLRRLRRTGRTEWLLGISDWVAVAVVALLAFGRLDAPAASNYFVAWLLARAGSVIVSGLIEIVAGARVRAEQADDRALSRALGMNALVAIGVLAGLLGIVQVMTPVLGEAYGTAVGPARLFSFVVIPWSVVSTLTLRLRAEGRLNAVIGVRAAIAIVVMILAAVLVGPFGATGLVLAWLVTVSLAAVACLAALTVWWWGPRLRGRPAAVANRSALVLQRVRRLSERSELNQQVNEHVGHLYQTMPAWDRESASTIRQTLVVAGHDGRPPLRLELSRTDVGAEQLDRRRKAVSEINGLASLGLFRNLVPFPIDHGDALDRRYLVESVVSGERGDAPANAALHRQRVEAITDAVVELHHETAFTLDVDKAVLDTWVARPLRRLGDSVRLPDAELARVAAMIFEGLNGLSLAAARIHGSLRADQALFEKDGNRLTGLLNWEWSETGPVALDWGVLALSSIMQEERRDLGPVVRDLLDEPAKLRLHPAFVTAVGDTVPPAVLVLMAWLQYMRPVVMDSGSQGLSRYWEARNVRPVVHRLLSGPAL